MKRRLNIRNTEVNRGFTLVELLVVIAIISLLSSVVFASINGVRLKARETNRVANIRSLKIALDLYFDDNGSYPVTGAPTGDPLIAPAKRTECADGVYIPGLASKYISLLPTDPALDCGGVAHSWSYASDGNDYKLITHIETNLYARFTDPAWDGGPDKCVIDGGNVQHYGVWTEGAVCWSI